MIGGVALLGAETPPRRVVDLVGTGAVGLPPSRSPPLSSPAPALPSEAPELPLSPRGSPSLETVSTSALVSSNRATLTEGYFIPPKSSLGNSLRKRCPALHTRTERRSAPSVAMEAHARELSDALAHRAQHVAGVLPSSAISRILDRKSKGSSSQVSQTSRQRLAKDAIAESGGKDGASLLPKLTTLANFADFAAAGGFREEDGSTHPAVNIFSVEVGDALVAEYLRWERARGYLEGSKGLAPQALANLRFARDHLGLDAPDLASDLVSAAAQMSVDHAAGEEIPPPKGSGSLPLRLVAGQEKLANSRGGRGPEGLSQPAFVWVCLRIIAFVFGLRGKEMRSARLEPAEEDTRYIYLSFHPKGSTSKPRIVAWRWAFGVMGEFLWWPSIRAVLLGLPSLEPNFQQLNKPSCSGNVLTADRLGGIKPLAPKGSDAWLLIYAILPFGLPPATLVSLGIKKHSAHGTLSDVIGVYGGELSFDIVLDALAAGHWIASASSTGAGGGGRSSDAAGRRASTDARADAASAAAMPTRYRNGQHRGTPKVEGPRVVWSVLSLAFYFISETDTSLEDIDPSQGWVPAQAWALGHRGRAYPSEPPFSSPPFSGSHMPPPPL